MYKSREYYLGNILQRLLLAGAEMEGRGRKKGWLSISEYTVVPMYALINISTSRPHYCDLILKWTKSDTRNCNLVRPTSYLNENISDVEQWSNMYKQRVGSQLLLTGKQNPGPLNIQQTLWNYMEHLFYSAQRGTYFWPSFGLSLSRSVVSIKVHSAVGRGSAIIIWKCEILFFSHHPCFTLCTAHATSSYV